MNAGTTSDHETVPAYTIKTVFFEKRQKTYLFVWLFYKERTELEKVEIFK